MALLMQGLLAVIVLAAALVLLALAAGRLGLLRGRPPSRLGVTEGRLKPPSRTPNSVSSQADLWLDHPQRDYARIEPLPANGDADAVWAHLNRVVAGIPGAVVVKAERDYLYAQCSTRWLKFTDDVEFWLDRGARVIHVRSSSRLGRKDYGANRRRIQALRAAYEAA